MAYKLDYTGIMKALGPRLVSRALQAFDRATIIVVGACWAAALLMMVFALYTLNMSARTQRDMVAAAASEPALPKVQTDKPSDAELAVLVDRLHKRFPDILIKKENGQVLTVSTSEGANFRLWLTVLGYIDTMSPQYRWTIRDFCVGLKCGKVPMNATLAAEKITFKVDPAPAK